MFETNCDFDLDDEFEEIISASFPSDEINKIQNCVFNYPKALNAVDKKEHLPAAEKPSTSSFVDPNKVPGISRNCAKSPRNSSPHPAKKVVKRKFPGPAGLLPDENIGTSLQEITYKRAKERTPSDNEDEILCSQQSATVYEEGPWSEMEKDFKCVVADNLNIFDKYNIRWIKANAASKKLIGQKVPFLAAIIQSIDGNSTVTNISLTLKDMTGEIEAAIILTLYQDYSEDLTIGSVIVLKQFGVFTAGNNRHYLTITQNNLIAIYTRNIPQSSLNKSVMDHVEHSHVVLTSHMHCPAQDGPKSVRKITLQRVNSRELIRQWEENVITTERTNNTSSHDGFRLPNPLSSVESMVNVHQDSRKVVVSESPRKLLAMSSSRLSSSDSPPDPNCIRNVMSPNLVTNFGMNSKPPVPSLSIVASQQNSQDNIPLRANNTVVVSRGGDSFASQKNITKQYKIPVHSEKKFNFVTKRPNNNIFDTADLDDLNLCFEDEIISGTFGEGSTLNSQFKIDNYVAKKQECGSATKSRTTKASTTNQLRETIKGVSSSHENSKNRNISETNSEKSVVNNKNANTEDTLKLLETNQAVITSRNTNSKSILQTFKFIPKNCYIVNNGIANNKNNENKEPCWKNVTNGKENITELDECDNNVVINGSQLSVRTTNSEHNQIWKNVLDDIDTDSLFEDF